jgi:hypothetical protein
MKTKHTPGPWNVDKEIDDKGNTHIDIRAEPIYKGSVGFQVCSVNEFEDFKSQGANAALIAAAPEMLAVLEQLDLCRGPEDQTAAAIAIRNVIKKAKGE